MDRIAKLLVAVVLLAVAAFCAFGFLASYEPPPSPARLALRLAYAAVGLASLAGAGVLIARALAVRRPPRGFPVEPRPPHEEP